MFPPRIRAPYTIDDAIAADFDDTPFPEPGEYTLVGHWYQDDLVVEFIDPGANEDTRPDTGYWPEGLWAASFRGTSEADLAVSAWEEYDQARYVKRATLSCEFTPASTDEYGDD